MSKTALAAKRPAPKAAPAPVTGPPGRAPPKAAPAPAGPSMPPAFSLSAGPTQLQAPALNGALQLCEACAAAEEEPERQGDGGFQLEAAGAPAAVGGAGPSPHAVASRGLGAADAPLPRADRIQAAFGRHDVSGVRVKIGGLAAGAARSLGAKAFTCGDQIGFRSRPSLRLAAHEAAHTVQQRRGVQLAGGIGRPGDPYEQQADDAAEAVVAGHSAEAILDRDPVAPGEDGDRAVQTACDCGGTCLNCAAAAEEEKEEDLLQMELSITTVPPSAPEAEKKEVPQGEGEGEAAATSSETAEKGKDPKEQVEASAEATDKEQKTGGLEAAAVAEGRSSSAGPEEAPTGTTGRVGPSTEEVDAARERRRSEDEERQFDEGDPKDLPPEERNHEGAEDEEALQMASCGATSEPANVDEDEPPAEPPPGEVQEDVEAEGPTAEEQDEDPEAIERSLDEVDPGGEVAEGLDVVGEAVPTGSEIEETAAGGGGGAAVPVVPAALAVVPALADEIAAATEGRGLAVADFAAGLAAVEAAQSGGRGLVSIPIEFAEGGDSEARDQASAALGAMLRTAAGSLESTAGQTQATIVDRVGATSDEGVARIRAAAQIQRGLVTTQIAAARASTRSEATTKSAALTAHHLLMTGAVDAASNLALAQLDADKAGADARINAAQIAQFGPLVAAYARADTRIRGVGDKIGAEAIEIGETYYDAYKQDRKVDSSGDCIEDSWYDGCLCDRKARARMKAARDVAKGYKDSLIEEAGKQVGEAAKGLPRDISNIASIADNARTTAETQYTASKAMIETRRAAAIAALDAARSAALSEIEASRDGTLANLDALQARQMANLTELEFLQIIVVERTAHAAAAAALNNVAMAIQSATAGIAGAASNLMGGPPSAPDEMQERLSGVQAMLDGALASLSGSVDMALAGFGARMDAQAGEATATIAEAGASGVQQANAMAGTAVTALGSIFSAAAAQISDAFAAMSADVAQIRETTATSFTAIADGLGASYKVLIERLDIGFENSAKQLESAFRDALGGMHSGENSIPAKAEEAASKEKPAWQSVLKWVLIIAIVIVVAVVAGPAVIGAIGGLAGALGASTAVAGFIGATVGGAILGAATSATIQVVNNVFAGETWYQGIGKAALTGAISGALGGAVGFGIGQAFNAGAQVGQQAVRSVGSRALEFGTNLAADATMEIAQQVIETGGVDWANFGVAMAFSVGTAGLGEVPRIKGIQEGISSGVSRAASGAVSTRIRPEVGVRPDADLSARIEADATARPVDAEAAPRPSEASAGPDVPRPAEAEPRAEPEPAARGAEEDGRIADSDLADVAARAAEQPAPRLDANPNAPTRTRTDSELIEAATAVRLNGEDHTLVPRRWIDGEVRLFLCTDCGPIIAKLTEIIKATPDPRLRSGLERARAEIANIEAQIKAGADSDTLQSRLAEFRDAIRVYELDVAFSEAARLSEVGEPTAPTRPTEEVEGRAPEGTQEIRDRPNIPMNRVTNATRQNAARQLEASLEAAARPRPPGAYEPHHIVEFADAKAQPARDVLAEHGIGLNTAVNGVWLERRTRAQTQEQQYPRETFEPHDTVIDPESPASIHSEHYVNRVNELLTAPQVREDKAAVIRVLYQIRIALELGRLP